MGYPNLWGFLVPAAAEKKRKEFEYIRDSGCFAYAMEFLCAAHFPKCVVNKPLLSPCKSYCRGMHLILEVSYNYIYNKM